MAIVFSDTFTDTDGVKLESHTPTVGTSYSVVDATIIGSYTAEINTNRLRSISVGFGAFYRWKLNPTSAYTANHSVSFGFGANTSNTGTGDIRFQVRYQGDTSRYEFRLVYNNNTSGTTVLAEIRYVSSGGTVTVLTSTTFSPATYANDSIVCTVNGTSLTMTRNGSSLLSTTNSSIAAAGDTLLYIGSNDFSDAIRIDNLFVTNNLNAPTTFPAAAGSTGALDKVVLGSSTSYDVATWTVGMLFKVPTGATFGTIMCRCATGSNTGWEGNIDATTSYLKMYGTAVEGNSFASSHAVDVWTWWFCSWDGTSFSLRSGPYGGTLVSRTRSRDNIGSGANSLVGQPWTVFSDTNHDGTRPASVAFAGMWSGVLANATIDAYAADMQASGGLTSAIEYFKFKTTDTAGVQGGKIGLGGSYTTVSLVAGPDTSSSVLLRTDFAGAFNPSLFASTETAGTVTQTGGEILFNYNTGYPGICYVDDVTAMDMTGKTVAIEMSTFPTSNPCYMRFYVLDTTGTGWGVNFAYSTTATGALSLVKIVSGVVTVVSAFNNYDNVSHKFMRLREGSGLVSVDRSPDGTTWTNVGGFFITAQISGVKLTAMKSRFGQTNSDGNGIYGVTSYWAPALTASSSVAALRTRVGAAVTGR